ncbi:cyclomaltodextrin glucanotransferase [Actinoplanes sp. SE50]|uniref:CBM20 domain-containing protein n=1 Tax=unclassified Actinoplanes TaxID=2626549 RepID=UPI00023EC9DB|nr:MULTISPECIES: CBM20 domain-containing protein [unclassified Actinoplanes]AEV85978.1 Cyclomaltodextrin glucanotransferase [Actinoplanes sp. SE50/110]ATO84376.1 cyclomaltodextrin glucanotransferase [Actinoplanes sp. SE50]SLM01786.1 small carbohydrate-binding protein [Actinoplanes sp. SE50/110]
MNRTTVRAGVLATALISGVLGVAGPALAAPVTDAAPVAAAGTAVAPIAATFNVTAGFTSWGQNVYVVGSIPALGSWDVSKAVPLTTTSSAFPTWTGSVALPANTYTEFQYVVKNADGSVARWEKGFQQNRTTITPPTGTYVTHDTFGAY